MYLIDLITKLLEMANEKAEETGCSINEIYTCILDDKTLDQCDFECHWSEDEKTIEFR